MARLASHFAAAAVLLAALVAPCAAGSCKCFEVNCNDADTSKAGNYGYKLDCAVEVVGDLKVVGDAFGDRSCTTSVLTAPTSKASTWTFKELRPSWKCSCPTSGSCYQAQKTGTNCCADAGAVYVSRSRYGRWYGEAYLKAPNAGGGDQFGHSVAIEDGVVVVGAIGEASCTTDAVPGPGPYPSGNCVLPSYATSYYDDVGSNCCTGAGAVYVFSKDGGSWASTAYLKSPAAAQSDYASDPQHFGDKVSIESGEITVDAVGNSPESTYAFKTADLVTEPPAADPPAADSPATEPPATDPPAAAGGDDGDDAGDDAGADDGGDGDATEPPTKPPAAASVTSNLENDDADADETPVGAIAGGAAGGVAALVIVIGIVAYCRWNQRALLARTLHGGKAGSSLGAEVEPSRPTSAGAGTEESSVVAMDVGLEHTGPVDEYRRTVALDRARASHEPKPLSTGRASYDPGADASVEDSISRRV